MDRIKIYMQPPNTFTFQYAASNLASDATVPYLSTWNGSAWVDDTTGGGFHNMAIGENGRVILNPAITMPDEQHKVIPKAKYLLAANDRLFSANTSLGSSELWISKERIPWHNRRTTIYFTQTVHDPRSPTSLACETEILQGLVAAPSSSPTNPENTVYVVSDKHVWSLSGDFAGFCLRLPKDAIVPRRGPASTLLERGPIGQPLADDGRRQVPGHPCRATRRC
jgi:hypothetical protein